MGCFSEEDPSVPNDAEWKKIIENINSVQEGIAHDMKLRELELNEFKEELRKKLQLAMDVIR
jgi:hypothetical protein